MRSGSAIFILFVLTATFVSCQKEYSFESDGTVGPPAETDLLVRAEVEDAGSKLLSLYEYNSSGKILKSLSSFNAGSITGDLKIEATRDASGKLSGSRLVVASTFNPSGDTANYQLIRNSTGRVIAMTIKPNPTVGPSVYDSVVVTYNTANKISSYIYYSVTRNGTSINIEPYEKFDFTYAGDNVIQRKQFVLLGSVNNSELFETLNMQYDAKPASRVLTEEEYLLELAPINGLVPSVNNLVRQESISALDPDENYITVYVYVYGANNKPSTAKVTTTYAAGGESISNIKFFYN